MRRFPSSVTLPAGIRTIPSSRVITGRVVEQLMDFLVTGLREVFVPESHRLERFRRVETDHVFRLFPKIVAGVGCAHRTGDDDSPRSELAKGGDSGAHGRSGRQSIIDDDPGL